MKKQLLTALVATLLAAVSTSAKAETKTTLLAGGCFWCLEHDIGAVPGVLEATSGYAGGDRPEPSYETYHDLDSTYKIPHIEVVQVKYDDKVISYSALLSKFMRKIDPTDSGGQFCDRGPSYRPAIFATTDEEKKQAEQVIKESQKIIGQEIKVEILPAAQFWAAEEYHQHYADKNPIRYKFYRTKCGRDQRIQEIWGSK